MVNKIKSHVENAFSAAGNDTSITVSDNSSTDTVYTSAVEEWDLVCEREKMKAAISSAPMIGYVFGGLLFGAISDKYGRKPAFLVSKAVFVMAGVTCSVAPNYWTFLIMRYDSISIAFACSCGLLWFFLFIFQGG